MISLLDLPYEIRYEILKLVLIDADLEPYDISDVLVKGFQDRVCDYAEGQIVSQAELQTKSSLTNYFWPRNVRPSSLPLLLVNKQLRRETGDVLQRIPNTWQLDLWIVIDRPEETNDAFLSWSDKFDSYALPIWTRMTHVGRKVDKLTVNILSYNNYNAELRQEIIAVQPRRSRYRPMLINASDLLTVFSRIARAGPAALDSRGPKGPVEIRHLEVAIDLPGYADSNMMNKYGSTWPSRRRDPIVMNPTSVFKSSLLGFIKQELHPDPYSGPRQKYVLPTMHLALSFYSYIISGEIMCIYTQGEAIRNSAEEVTFKLANFPATLIRLRADTTTASRTWRIVEPKACLEADLPDEPCHIAQAGAKLLGVKRSWLCAWCHRAEKMRRRRLAG